MYSQKIHNNCALCLIVDCTGTIGKNTPRWLAHIIEGLVRKTKHHAKNQTTGTTNIVIEEEDSIFTNTPIGQVLEIVKTRLKTESVLRDYKKMEPSWKVQM